MILVVQIALGVFGAHLLLYGTDWVAWWWKTRVRSKRYGPGEYAWKPRWRRWY